MWPFSNKKDNSQAKKISAWIEKENDDGTAWIAILNESTIPISKMIISVVNIQSTASSGKDAPVNCRSYVKIVPPGKYYTGIFTHHGMHFLPGVEIAFIDNAGHSWLRDGSGKIFPLTQPPHEYYALNMPLSWETPLTGLNDL